MPDWFGYNVTCSVAFPDTESRGSELEGYDEYVVAFLTKFANAPSGATNNHVLSALVPIFLNMMFRGLKRRSMKITTSKMTRSLGFLTGIISIAFWIDNKNDFFSSLLGVRYSDKHADWIKWTAYALTCWYGYAGILKLVARRKKFVFFPYFLLVALAMGASSDFIVETLHQYIK
mmetsp:Transcript_20020/g.43544  ORF Transcript_20020/g.43544 Transcript_20020/m.43544 type:complete len:175 (-) Transcript_20020:49-573(-)|eukprot:CAMPEP_0168267092 /NCGR_PEP_ID=MMETSP0141_2-20121125/12908_1 /TAXON_ID=44445 /ORGANISM="Pseudo-nitzschia australis, Strain 10249 10 AB" /LENGTH=174 /DNA_ID=CAMNT_0008207245 /DNA_START=129 /DNA_END=653 /DNA_ORIENTATION=+